MTVKGKSQASTNDTPPNPLGSHVVRGLREGALFLFAAVASYLMLSLFTYNARDPGWSHSGDSLHVGNAGGIAGAWFADVALYLFGYMAYVFPVMVAYTGWLLYAGHKTSCIAPQRLNTILRTIGFVLTLTTGAGLAYLHLYTAPGALPLNAGGILGEVAGNQLRSVFSFVGATLFLLALFLSGVSLFTGLSWVRLLDTVGGATLNALAWVRARFVAFGLWWSARRGRRRERREPSWAGTGKQDVPAKAAPPKPAPKTAAETPPSPPRTVAVQEEKPKKSASIVKLIRPKSEKVPAEKAPPKDAKVLPIHKEGDTALPPLSLLDEPQPNVHSLSEASLEELSRLLEMKLRDFGVEVQVVEVHPGPVITRFELQPAPGVKSSQIVNLSKDLARALSSVSVRVVEVIPGKTTVGLELPNEHRELVYLAEILRSKAHTQSHSKLTLALGKDISGHPVVADLAKMPHLLVAGTTGSGKSVAINAMILSLLYNATPKEVRMIMVDPKMLELSIYEGIPHLLAPVVTDMKDAANALRWSVAEMERRYKLMANVGVRNLAGFNRKIGDALAAGEPIPDPLWEPAGTEEEADRPHLETLPFIVVVVDELADMMMVVGKKVEELIARLAQKARAAGIHLILATQRPSVDVLTGLIKANIPTRIAFQVSSRVDSRTILDQMGAEHLLGHGDMLYLPPGQGMPVRVHGAFVDDHEVHAVVDNLKQLGEPDYLDEIIDGPADSAGGDPFSSDGSDAEADPLYDEAVKVVTETRRASVSGVQRRLKIGYNRAARMVEEMERAGVVGPLQSNGSREVLAPPPIQD